MKNKKAELTIDEKIKLLTGKDNWQTEDLNGKLPNVIMTDGPHGVRKYDKDWQEVGATSYPTLSSIAHSWNPTVAYEMGQCLADDCIEYGADILLAPGVNIKRTPLCGRNFEYFSEDPLLAGTLAYQYIIGVQEKGIGTSLKHFAVNNREVYRHEQSSEVDVRTLHEIYLKPFELAVKAQPWTVMCSYNPINGIYASENKKLLNGILREQLGFEGLIVSDWCAVKNLAKSVKATLDLEMPYLPNSFSVLKDAYLRGFVTEEEIDARVDKVLELIQKSEESKKIRKQQTSREERHQKAVAFAEECIVLLKNEGDILPLEKTSAIDYVIDREDNSFLGGSGSSQVNTKYPIPLLETLLKEKGMTVEKHIRITAKMEQEIAVVTVGNKPWYLEPNPEGEDYDREDIRLTKRQENLIRAVAKTHTHTIVLLHTGSAVDTSAWIDEVDAVIQVGFAGEGQNEALAKILIGEVCPSGKLSETYPLCLEDTPTGEEIGNGEVEKYEEGLFVGYRYYDSYGVDVAFPFGYGLSYAKFEYSDLQIEKESETDYIVSYKITNTSKVDGKEISQVYVRDEISTVVRPEKELKGYSKDFIKAGESKIVKVKLDKNAFAYYSENLDDWYVENGKFEILVGASSLDIRLSRKITVRLPEDEQFSAHNQFKEKIEIYK